MHIGEIYRYRIKNIIRLTKREKTREKVENSDFIRIKNLVTQKLNEEIAKNIELFSNPNSFFNVGLSAKNSLIYRFIDLPLFDNFYARIDSSKIEIYQKGVQQETEVALDKNSLITNVSILSKNFNVYLPLPNQFSYVEKVNYRSYYYESLPSNEWSYVDIVENLPPPPPECIKINPNTLSKQIIISWLRPSNSQRDIAAYRVYRRNALGKEWELVKEIRELNITSSAFPDRRAVRGNSANLCIDDGVEVGQTYIYALTCVDVHDIESFLSVQIQAQLNPDFAFEREEKPLKWISGSGARKDELNFVYKKFLNRTEQIIAKKNVKIKPKVSFNDTEKAFIIRVTSLDTHQKKEYRLLLKNEVV